jgi:carbonic anhydrase/acetyltransferase-like protein (isoleucine patch superfamily)/Leucine-rich repeat (LRR) protein
MDLVVGQPQEQLVGLDQGQLDGQASGRAYVFFDAASRGPTLTLAERDLELEGEGAADGLGRLATTPALDLDGDGVADLLVGAVDASGQIGGERAEAGRLYLAQGSPERFPLPGPDDREVLGTRTVTGSGTYLVDQATGRPERFEETLAAGVAERWFRLSTLGDGWPDHFLRLVGHREETRLAVPSHAAGGVLMLDLSAFLFARPGDDRVGELALVLGATTGSSPGVSVDWAGRTSSSPTLTATAEGGTVSVALRDAAELALADGATRIEVEIDLPEGVTLEGATARLPGVLGDLYDANGGRLDAADAVFDLRTLEAGTYYLRVYDGGSPESGDHPSRSFAIEAKAPPSGSSHGSLNRDVIDGGADEDWVVGGPGLDAVRGGSARDTFIAEEVEARDHEEVDADPLSVPPPGDLSEHGPALLDRSIDITDEPLRLALAEALGMTITVTDTVTLIHGPILGSALAKLTSLDLHDRGIASLTGLQYATNLELLDLADTANPVLDNAVSDLGPLKAGTDDDGAPYGLKRLEVLVLDGNPVASLADLEDLEALRALAASDLTAPLILAIPDLSQGAPPGSRNGITDLESLQYLSLDRDGLADVSDLAGLDTLRWLSLVGNQIEDISPLARLDALEFLFLRDNQIGDVSSLLGVALLDDEDASFAPAPPERSSWTGDPTSGVAWLGGANAGAFAGDYRFHVADSGDETATWIFAGLNPAWEYEVWVTWPVPPSEAPTQPATAIYTLNGTALDPISQAAAPDGASFHGRPWQSLGVFPPNGSNGITVVLSGSGSGTIAADAVRLVALDPATGQPVVPARHLKVLDLTENPLDEDAHTLFVADLGDELGGAGERLSFSPNEFAPEITSPAGPLDIAAEEVKRVALAATDTVRFTAATDDVRVAATIDGKETPSIADDELVLTPQAGFSGTVRVTVTAWDGPATTSGNPNGRFTEQSFDLTVGPKGAIYGTLFYDSDRDGIQDAGEVPLEGWTVFLDDGDGTLEGGEARTLTDAEGTYAFTDLDAGTYTVERVLPFGWEPTSRSDARNGGFEDPATAPGQWADHWQRIGDAVRTGSTGSLDPLEGTSWVLLTTRTGAQLHELPGPPEVSGPLETFLDHDPDDMSPYDLPDTGEQGYEAEQVVFEGSAIRQQVVVEAGTQLFFDWAFLTNEPAGSTFQDVVFLAVSGRTTEDVVVSAFLPLARVSDVDAGLLGSSSIPGFARGTAYQTQTPDTPIYTFLEPGTYTVSIGVADAYDGSLDSALLVDRVRLEFPPVVIPLAGGIRTDVNFGNAPLPTQGAPVAPDGSSDLADAAFVALAASPAEVTAPVAAASLAVLEPAATSASRGETVFVSPSAQLAPDVGVGDRVEIRREVRIGAGSRIGDDVLIRHSVRVGPLVEIGSGSIIGQRARIEAEAVIGRNVQIGATAVIGAGARIGAGATIRPGAVIPPGAVVLEGSVVAAVWSPGLFGGLPSSAIPALWSDGTYPSSAMLGGGDTQTVPTPRRRRWTWL